MGIEARRVYADEFLYVVSCDRCGVNLKPPGYEGGPSEIFLSKEEAERSASNRRWVLDDGGAEAYCPTCAQRTAAEENDGD